MAGGIESLSGGINRRRYRKQRIGVSGNNMKQMAA